jgi:RND family efflux transporter MFP subunit
MGRIVKRLGAAIFLTATVAVAGCGESNRYQPPPAAKVTVAKPEERKITLYMEATGTTAAFNRVDLVARVQGFLEKVAYKDGATVKKGDLLFQIDQQDYKIALQIAQATVQQQEALLLQADADLKRKQELVKTAAVSVANVDDARAKRDSTFAALEQAKGQVEQAKRNLEYTTIFAPFDGAVSARLVDPGAFVGAGSPTKLATIVQINPLYIKFNIDEQQVLSVRERMREAGVTLKDLGPIPVGIRLQTEQGYPHTGTLDYVAPEIDSSTGTLAARAVIDNKDSVLEPGLFVRVRVPKQIDVPSLLVPDEALGNNQQGRYVLIVNDKNIVEQRQVEVGELVDGGLRIVKSGLTAGDSVIIAGTMRALPGSTVIPELTTLSAPEPAADVSAQEKAVHKALENKLPASARETKPPSAANPAADNPAAGASKAGK